MDAAGPGPGVFRNLEPISREDRSATRNKDVLEKNRLAARQQAPLTSAQSHLKLPPVVNPIQPIKQSSLYIEEYDR